MRLRALTPAHVQGLYREMQDRRLSARTVEYTHAVLHRALKRAVRWSVVPRNVCGAVDVPQVRREEMHPLTPEQARRFLDAARGGRLEALYVAAVHAGLWQDHGPIPIKRGHAALSAQRRALVQDVLRRAGLPAAIRLYDLKHTRATLLLCRNVHREYVQ